MKTTLRRNQLITPFGVGALHILKGSVAVVTGGLDYWFERADSSQINLVRVEEPRLQARLGVSHFRQPPGPETHLPGLAQPSVPLFRFPTWYVCPNCHQMDQRSLYLKGNASCTKCEKETLIQIRFVAVCDHGHLQDFPWREWVHRSPTVSCDAPLKYSATGGGSLENIRITCGCKKSRGLQNIMSGGHPDPQNSDPKRTTGWSYLSSSLRATPEEESSNEKSSSEPFLCQGGRPWLGELTGQCHRPLRAILINATNAHYAQVSSALWIPNEHGNTVMESLREKLDAPDIRPRVDLLRSFNISNSGIAANLTSNFPERFTAEEIACLEEYLSGGSTPKTPPLSCQQSEEEIIRYPEFLKLQERQFRKTDDDHLEIRVADTAQLAEYLKIRIASVSLVDRLRETRVFTGFTRLLPQSAPDGPLPSSHLWKNAPVTEAEKWLPAALVFGEGIFIRFAEEALQSWEAEPTVIGHLRPLIAREQQAAERMKRPIRALTPRFILLHTLAHLLIRRLTFECGYGSSALRERLYISNSANPMGGILIYTASGDSEGSMGGLVRMGEPENLNRIFESVLEDARWCSSDPICTESGQTGGQGMDGLNIAACHCCALLPETACENFNSLLDRSLITGLEEQGLPGFFA